LKSLLYCHGLISSVDKKISGKWVNHLMQNIEDNELGYCIKMYADEWLYLNKKIKEIEIKLKDQAIKDSELEAVYKSAPGIGSINARILANELGDMTHFKNEKGLFSFTGLTPCEHSSGEHRRQGNISRQGISLLRKILVQAAWVAIKQDLALKNIFERTANKSGKKRAIVGIARRLIGRIRACFMKKQLYTYGLIG
jgi:transposase